MPKQTNTSSQAAQTKPSAKPAASSGVKIETVKMALRLGGREARPEKYPFGELAPSKFVSADRRIVEGPSFVIPKAESPATVMAAGRKRHKGTARFLSRSLENGDVRVWRHPDDALPEGKADAKAGAKPEEKKTTK